MATIPIWVVGFIETPITSVKPLHFESEDSHTLIHSVIQTYHPETTEQIYVYCQGMTQMNIPFEVKPFST